MPHRLLAVVILSCTAGVATAQQRELLDLTRHPDRTVQAGQPFRAVLFGEAIERPFRDRRRVAAWDLGFVDSPGIDGGSTLPLVSLYLWQHADDGHLLRVLANGIDNELFYAAAFDGERGAEWVATFESFTWPGALGERVDGEVDEREELVWGYARPGFGIGWRERVGPQQDNMFAIDLIGEVGALYFGRGDQTSPGTVLPDSTLELRAKARLRYDLLTHNIIELPHEGVSFGADLVYGNRESWHDWGDPAIVTERGDGARDYLQLTAHAFGITAAPWTAGEGQRLVAALHAGAGDGVDRFSARRVGGGPDTRGGEFELTSRPVLPGASVGEYFPRRYALLYLGWRVELTWFAFLDLGVTTGPLDRDRAGGNGRERRDDWMTAASARLSSGCFGNTRLQLLTAYGFDEVRNGDRGGWSVALQLSGYF